MGLSCCNCIFHLSILGTGSGSLSHAFLRTLAPSGFLHTFDFHEERSQKAKIEFDDHELGKFVTATHRDVCVEGFGLENVADAVFLDLPKPWLAVPHAKHSMKLGGKLEWIVMFSIMLGITVFILVLKLTLRIRVSHKIDSPFIDKETQRCTVDFLYKNMNAPATISHGLFLFL